MKKHVAHFQWDLGRWTDEVAKLVVIEKSRGTIDISIDMDGAVYEQIASKIATEAVEEFFNEANDYSVRICADGLQVGPGKGVKISWNQVTLAEDGGNAMRRLRHFIEDQEELEK